MVIPKINSAHGSDTRNIINQAIDSINAQGKSIQDLVANGQLTPAQYAQLINTVNQNIKKGQISNADLDLNNFEVTDQMLSTAVKQMMAGNTPVNAEPANNSLTTAKYVNDSVTTQKVTNNVVEGKLLANYDRVVFDYTEKTLTIGSSRIASKRNTHVISSIEFDFSGLPSTFHYLYYLPSTNTINAISLNNSALILPEEAVRFATFRPDIPVIHGLIEYTVDGKRYRNQPDNTLTDFDFHGFFAGNPGRFNFDFKNKKIVISASAGRIMHKRTNYNLTEQTIDFSQHTSGYFKLVYNVDTSKVEMINYSPVTSGNRITFAVFNVISKDIFNIDNCYVDGKPNIVTNTHLEWSPNDDLYVVDGDLNGVYSSEILESKDRDSGDWLSDKTSAEMYAHYDSLITNHSGYISKTLALREPTGLPIYRYDLKPQKPVSHGDIKTPKIVIFSGIHGSERSAAWITYQFAKNLCENWQSDPILEALRWNVHIVIIALVNPWGWDNGGARTNSNGVDLNRQFPTFWNPNTNPGDSEYGGTAPLSEVEAQYVNSILENEKDVIYACDFHNFSISADDYMIWNAAGTTFNQNIGSHLVSKMSRKWKKEYPYLPQADNKFFGYVSNTPGGTIAMHAAREHKLQASTFEVSQGMQTEPNGLVFSSDSLTMGYEAFVNWIAMVVRNNVHLINSQRTKNSLE